MAESFEAPWWVPDIIETIIRPWTLEELEGTKQYCGTGVQTVVRRRPTNQDECTLAIEREMQQRADTMRYIFDV